MASDRSTFRLLQAVGITTTGLITGYSISLSTAVVPRLLESPTPLLLRQWVRMLNEGGRIIISSTILNATLMSFLAYSSHKIDAHRHIVRSYLAAGAISLMIVPYTFAFIVPTNKKLIAKEKETRELSVTDTVSEPDGETAHALVDKWGMLNLGRSFLLGTGAFIGAYTSVMHEL